MKGWRARWTKSLVGSRGPLIERQKTKEIVALTIILTVSLTADLIPSSKQSQALHKLIILT